MKKLALPFLAALALTAALAGCSFAPKYERPAQDIPAAWSASPPAEGLEIAWWRRFGDPVLDKLVEAALLNNQTIYAAMARVDQARGLLGVARAQQFPTLNGVAGATRTRLPASGPGAPRENEQWNAGLQAVWEIDLWGKFRNATAAAREQLLASEAAQQGVLLALAGQTATAYFSLRNYDLQLVIAERTLKTRVDALKIYKARYEQGIISELDFLRAKTEADTMRANVYTAQSQVATAESALMVLTGRSPRAIFEESPERGLRLDTIPAAPLLPSGLPSELLERRPDIMEAEATLRSANFQIGVAKAQWFPSISLTGSLGNQSLELDKLFRSGADVWAYGAQLTVPLLSFGRISSNVKVSEAITREAVANYNYAVQQAFQEIRDALSTQVSTRNIIETLSAAASSLRKSVDLAVLRYENGYAAYLEVLDAERTLYDTEIQLANVQANHLTSIVQLCMALGGGWKE